MRVSLAVPIQSRRSRSNTQWTEVLESVGVDWIRTVGQKLELIRNAPHNWDGKGGEPIRPSIINIACELLMPLASMEPPIPRIAPVLGGGIQFEWDFAGRELEVEVLPDGTVEYLVVDEDGTASEDQLPDLPVREVQRLVQWLVHGR